ncbi:Syndecan-4 [Oryzias melastigma]|uniref:Syndecan n=2 Tax=Oryzias melastigma TaxID=30732 RepID=A0A834C459_ORYME|nr:Syndecan-4 [Oryzias melastigma]
MLYKCYLHSRLWLESRGFHEERAFTLTAAVKDPQVQIPVENCSFLCNSLITTIIIITIIIITIITIIIITILIITIIIITIIITIIIITISSLLTPAGVRIHLDSFGTLAADGLAVLPRGSTGTAAPRESTAKRHRPLGSVTIRGSVMFSLCLVLALAASVLSESVRETETWMPMKSTAAIGMSTHRDDLEASGDSEDGADFSFTDDEDYDSYGFSGSGDEETPELPTAKSRPSVRPDINDNKIPELDPPVLPTINEMDVIKESNEIPGLKKSRESNVSMSHAGEDSILNKTEVLAALIAGGAVSLLFAVLLILLLIYRMKKKDEGSYDLGKKPIYKKAPTTEIYA